MKKVFILTQSKDAPRALSVLRDVGVLHLENEHVPSGSDIEQLKINHKILTNILEILKADDSDQASLPVDDWQSQAQEILELEEMNLQLKDAILTQQIKIDFWTAWGNFEPQDFTRLAQKGIYLHLCEMTAAEISRLDPTMILAIISKKNSMVRCLIASPEPTVAFNTVALPEMSLFAMRELQLQDQEQIQKIKQQLKAANRYRKAFVYVQQSVAAQLTFQEALAGMGQQEKISYIKGFCPTEQCAQLQSAAQKEQWAIILQDPAPEDMVPTLLKNSRFVEFVRPVFEFMSIIPGYREADVSFCFLAFFSVFFGMLIGDAGYGLVFALLAGYLHWKMKNKVKDFTAFYLIYVLSGCAIVWGVLTGTFFGVSLFGKFLKPAFPWLSNERNVQLLCFTIGAIHLTIAHIWRGLRKLPSLLALADVGWVTIVWCAYFYAQQFILSIPVASFVNPAAIAAFVIIVIFSQSFDDIRKDVGGFATNILLTVLTVVSTLIDVISYIRLYAVGTAGLALAEAFNQMALSAGFHNLFLGIGAVLILLAGHTLNILLGIMAVMVHGLRLNILEFSGHLSLEWVGVHYDPFRKLEQKNS